ncbi:MAG: tRNA (N6-threonylcarbamoyladenosine(37)-N6)-methyltransferase TrmO [Lachnospiraceae bacterium]|nr:tRNA (N6-threonylcarbamoyladenosine(37)-N6)-methyltransferase TrmO [Lachnospiraceae bacterium]
MKNSVPKLEFCVIAHIENDYKEKFGIPRQSGLVESLTSRIVFEPEYRNPDAFRGIEGYSHLWLLWHFSEADRKGEWSPTVRPPRLGGNTRVGVFATRSPFRPNPAGLSSVKLERFEIDKNLGPVLYVSGADLLDGTPIFDVKPYLAYVDSHPEARDGFALNQKAGTLDVDIPTEWLEKVPEEKRDGLVELLAQDPRPQYQNAPERVYKMRFAELEVWFQVEEEQLMVCKICDMV